MESEDKKSPKEVAIKSKEAAVKFARSAGHTINSLFESARGSAQGQDFQARYCSWCYQQTDFTPYGLPFPQQFYKCTKCTRGVFRCGKCILGMGKVYEDGDTGSACAVCDKFINKWGELPQGDQGFCSQCTHQSHHILIRRFKLKKDLHQCSFCHEPTQRCGTCKVNFAKEGESKCLVCSGKIKSWDDTTMKKETTERHCSWCFVKAEHELVKKRLVQSDIYSCTNCEGSTAICGLCTKGMSRLNWFLCAVCFKTVSSWHKAHEQQKEAAAKYLQGGQDSERYWMSLDSVHKARAYELGMIRPFLFLVSMAPDDRLQVAIDLGFTYAGQVMYGDPHQEAIEIIVKDRSGLQARANAVWESANPLAQNVNWYEVLYRTSDKLFKKSLSKDLSYIRSIEICKEPWNAVLAELEDELILQSARYHLGNYNADQRNSAQESLLSESFVPLANNMRAVGITSEDIMLFTKIYLLKEQDDIPIHSPSDRTKQIATPNAKVAKKKAMRKNAAMKVLGKIPHFSPVVSAISFVDSAVNTLGLVQTLEELYPALTLILNQKVMLAVKGINISEFYPPPPSPSLDAKLSPVEVSTTDSFAVQTPSAPPEIEEAQTEQAAKVEAQHSEELPTPEKLQAVVDQ
eukprot:TRINITY_DN9080_c0_g1_i1.p1 TRINITY_DN9080_c0_g1~~TRINITY_DN9080_c0_g1_i1.p1  ORF type:complete len:631 (-),score=120.24 TRINITY_DN9080_c0_g1_i1:17-1909(-)